MKKLLFVLFTYSALISCKKEPSANFSFSGTMEVGTAINFSNLSINSDYFNWDFGDGSYSMDKSPIHIYSKPNIYTTTLKISDKGDYSSVKKSIKISGTTYSIINNSSYDLKNFCSFIWYGAVKENYFDHGTLLIGHETEIVITKSTQIFFEFKLGDFSYISAYSVKLLEDQHNVIIITNNTQIIRGTKKNTCQEVSLNY